MISVGGLAGFMYTHANRVSPVLTCMDAVVAPVKETSCSPEATLVWNARAPDSGVAFDDTQFQLSLFGVVDAPAGSASSIQAWTGLFAWKSFSANARRPSGHSISTSAHWSPSLIGVT